MPTYEKENVMEILSKEDIDLLSNGIEEDGEWELKPEILAYLAGIIDGEGCISIFFSRNRHVLQVSCKMTDTQAIDLLHEAFGGGRSKTPKRKGENFDTWSWTVSNKSANDCLDQLFPYLRVKKYQALIGLLYYKDCILGKVGSKTGKISEENMRKRDMFMQEITKAKSDKNDYTKPSEIYQTRFHK
jgi:hypothetical protein